MRAMPLIIIALLSTTAGAGEVWRWQDKSGGWHFGDRPPPGAAAEWYDTSRSRSTALSAMATCSSTRFASSK